MSPIGFGPLGNYIRRGREERGTVVPQFILISPSWPPLPSTTSFSYSSPNPFVPFLSYLLFSSPIPSLSSQQLWARRDPSVGKGRGRLTIKVVPRDRNGSRKICDHFCNPTLPRGRSIIVEVGGFLLRRSRHSTCFSSMILLIVLDLVIFRWFGCFFDVGSLIQQIHIKYVCVSLLSIFFQLQPLL